jgi:ABC-type cobalamin/Fe3+-siderophores transport system ATPase subunit
MASCSGGEAAEFADKLCVLKNGTLAAFDTPQRIFAEQRMVYECGIALEPCSDCNISFNKNCNTLNNAPNAIQINNLSFRYNSGAMILDDINLSLKENEIAVITGRNGCGKTTLLKNISGLERPDRGAPVR